MFKPGDTAVPFYVLLSGRMEIVQPILDGERMIALHEPGEFTEVMTMISSRRRIVIGRVTEVGEFLERIKTSHSTAHPRVYFGT